MKTESKAAALECGGLDELVPLFMAADSERKLAAFAALRAEDGPKPEQPPGSLRLYKMGEAAKVTGLSRTTLWRALRDGRIKAVEIRPGLLRIPESELRRISAA
jgi:excisionase family DNA binding protein